MQIAGATCVVCEERIRRAGGAGACLECEVAFHEGCLETTGECPECGSDYAALWQEQEERDRVARRVAGRENSKLAYRRKAGTATFVGSSVFGVSVWLKAASYGADPTFVLILLGLSAVVGLAGLAMIITGRSKG